MANFDKVANETNFFYIFDDGDWIQAFIVVLSHVMLFILLLSVIQIIRFEKFSPDRYSTLINKIWSKGKKSIY